jgi:hypothetical protein
MEIMPSIPPRKKTQSAEIGRSLMHASSTAVGITDISLTKIN